MEKKMETTVLVLGFLGDNAKEDGDYYNLRMCENQGSVLEVFMEATSVLVTHRRTVSFGAPWSPLQ